MYYWVRFKGRSAGTIEADTPEAAMEIAKEHGVPVDARPLPYPAAPGIARTSECPAFCYMPEKCAKSGYCWPNRHRRRSCDN